VNYYLIFRNYYLWIREKGQTEPSQGPDLPIPKTGAFTDDRSVKDGTFLVLEITGMLLRRSGERALGIAELAHQVHHPVTR
jgi:hypothetical protein